MRQARRTPDFRLVAFFLTIVACSDTTGPDPLVLPLRDKVVFESNQFDMYGDVFVMNIDGTDVRRLTDNTSTDLCPAVSPDGQWIAFLRGPEGGHPSAATVVLMQADGAGQRALSPGVGFGCPVWSRDSRLIGFASQRAIFTYTTDGDLVGESPGGIGGFSYSPDGSQLLINSYMPTISTPINFMFEISNLDGSNRFDVGYGESAVWSPSGSEIAYTACGTQCPGAPPDPCRSLCTISPAGVFKRDLGVADVPFSPVFSPDGQTIAYRCHASNICLIPAEGGAKVEIPTAAVSRLNWDQTGQHIGFSCGSGYATIDLCLVDVQTQTVSNLTNSTFAEKSISFSPVSSP